MQTVVETPTFQRQVAKLLEDDEWQELIGVLAETPEAGDPVPGTGGVRKLRFGTRGQGKSGGIRVIYYIFDTELPVYALLAYGKGEQVKLSADQKRKIAEFARAIKAEARKRR